MKIIHKNITDLGAAAYLMMYKHKISRVKDKSVYFEILEEEESDFDGLSSEYLTSDFHRFDTCLMSLKKMTDSGGTNQDLVGKKPVNDLGAAAYLMMKNHRVLKKKGKSIYFEGSKGKEIDQRMMDYLCSEFHRFDSCLMSLKKMREYSNFLSD